MVAMQINTGRCSLAQGGLIDNQHIKMPFASNRTRQALNKLTFLNKIFQGIRRPFKAISNTITILIAKLFYCTNKKINLSSRMGIIMPYSQGKNVNLTQPNMPWYLTTDGVGCRWRDQPLPESFPSDLMHSWAAQGNTILSCEKLMEISCVYVCVCVIKDLLIFIFLNN